MKTFSVLGDSISTFQGYIPEGFHCFFPREGYSVTAVEQTWWHLFSRKTGYALVQNNSFSGSRVSRTGIEHEHSTAFCENRRIDMLRPSDILIVFGGTNDFGQEKCQASLKRFQKAYSIMIAKLLARDLFSRIYLCTPLRRTDFSRKEKNKRGWTQEDLEESVRLAVSKAGDDRLSVIDLASLPVREGDGMLEDNLHPTAEGMKMIARAMEEAIGSAE